MKHHNFSTRMPSLGMRITAALLVAVQVVIPFQGAVFAAEPATRAPQETPPARVIVNRTVPRVDRPSESLSLSANPTDAEISNARLFEEPLVPIGSTGSRENQALGAALRLFHARTNKADVASLTAFLSSYPESAWKVSVLANMGLIYRKTGRFSKALECWEESWSLGRSANAPKASAVVDRAVGELAELNARLGRFERLEPLFNEIGGRNIRGSATEKIAGAQQGLWLMNNRPQDAFRCGPMALDRIRALANPSNAFDSRILQSESTRQGMSLSKVCDLANQLKMNYQMARRSPGSAVLIPSVVHWKVGHYAAITAATDDGKYRIEDPTFGEMIMVDRETLDAEASGYFLVESKSLPDGWQPVGGMALN